MHLEQARFSAVYMSVVEEEDQEEGIQAQHAGEYVWRGTAQRVAVEREREVEVEDAHFLFCNFFSKNAEEEGGMVVRVASAAA